MRSSLFVLLLATAAGCGDDGASATVDAPNTVDAPYDTARCLIQGHYGALGALAGRPSQGDTTLTIDLDLGPPRDTFFLKLTDGRGAFSGGLTTGTFPLTGPELDATTCGVCVNIIADIVAMQGPTKFYFATGGTVTLSQTTTPIGTLTDVTFQEATSGGTLVPGGCVASIDSMSFSM